MSGANVFRPRRVLGHATVEGCEVGRERVYTVTSLGHKNALKKLEVAEHEELTKRHTVAPDFFDCAVDSTVSSKRR